MARNRKLFIRDKTYFITFRAEAGLPLPATNLINRILEGILCKAKTLYSVDVICFKFMANHAHFLITVTCPESVDNFFQYIKRESAHAVNRLLGRRKRTVWCEGYDSPIILDQEKVLDIIAYIYSNAAEANITDSIDDYPGISSWHMFLTKEYSFSRKRLRRDLIPVIGTNSTSLNLQAKLIAELEKESLETNAFTLSPYAFLKSFETDSTEAELKEEIINRVRLMEQEYRYKRKKTLSSIIKFKTSGICLEYIPKKFGKKMICLGSEKKVRAAFIGWYKKLCVKASHIYQEYKNRVSELILPPGIFAPGGYLTANIWSSPY